MTKLMVALRKFQNAPKNDPIRNIQVCLPVSMTQETMSIFPHISILGLFTTNILRIILIHTWHNDGYLTSNCVSVFVSQKDHAAHLLKFKTSRTQATDKTNTHLCTRTYSGLE
jgi:hypothetical protein